MRHRRKQIQKAQDGVPAFPKNYRYDIATGLALFILDGLRQFRKANIHSYPQAFERHIEDWPKTVDKMIWSFDQIAHDYPDDPYNVFFNAKWKEAEAKGIELVKFGKDRSFHFHEMLDTQKPSKEEILAYQKRVQQGLDLFAKYFRDLWD